MRKEIYYIGGKKVSKAAWVYALTDPSNYKTLKVEYEEEYVDNYRLVDDAMLDFEKYKTYFDKVKENNAKCLKEVNKCQELIEELQENAITFTNDNVDADWNYVESKNAYYQPYRKSYSFPSSNWTQNAKYNFN